jgi:hypothetical protein
VGTDGSVLWKGHPSELSEKELGKALSARSKGSKNGTSIEKAVAALDSRELGSAVSLLDAAIADPSTDAAAKAEAEAWKGSILAAAQGLAKAAKTAQDESKDYFAARRSLERLARDFEGLPEAAEAANTLESWKNDKAIAQEIEGGGKFRKAEGLEVARDYDGAYRAYREVAKKYEGTAVGEQASAKASELKDGGMLGVKKSCRDCAESRRACPKHAASP